MSLIKRADVKNHLSTRHRTEIHLHRPESQPDATGFAEEETVGADPRVHNPVQGPLNLPTPAGPETAPIVTSKSAKA
jgi:hypothetical protein